MYGTSADDAVGTQWSKGRGLDMGAILSTPLGEALYGRKKVSRANQLTIMSENHMTNPTQSWKTEYCFRT